MSERIRFHLDENVNGAIALGLGRYGIDVTTTQEVGLSGQADEAQLEFVRREHRVLFTQDSDFLIMVVKVSSIRELPIAERIPDRLVK